MIETEHHPRTMNQVLDCVIDERHGDEVTVGDMLKSLGTRSYGPALLVVALISMLPPISITPGLPIVTAVLIIILSVQLLFLRSYPWLPQRILRISFTREKLAAMVKRARPWAERSNWWIGPRFSVMVYPPFVNMIALTCIGLAIMSVCLSPLPGGENIPMAAVLLFSLALTARDGLLASIGLLFSAGAVAALIYFWPFLFATANGLVHWLFGN